jgi:rubrerythrin
MSLVADTPVSSARLFEPEHARTLANLLSEIDYALNHGQPAPCLVCGAMTAGGDLGNPAECTSCGSRLE